MGAPGTSMLWPQGLEILCPENSSTEVQRGLISSQTSLNFCARILRIFQPEELQSLRPEHAGPWSTRLAVVLLYNKIHHHDYAHFSIYLYPTALNHSL